MELDEVAAREARLLSAVAELAELPWAQLPGEVVDSVLATLESAQRRQQSIGFDAINQLRAHRPGHVRRLRDQLANLLHLSAGEAGTRIATAADLHREQPVLPETAAAAAHGLIGAEHLRIIGDTIAKLPDTATDAERARFDLELTGVAVAERPEVLRRDGGAAAGRIRRHPR